MTYKEAIEIVTNAIQTEKMTAEQDKALSIVQKVVEKQIPVDKSNTILTVCSCARQSVCPKCSNVIITNPNEYPKYCTWCGQALKWGNENDRT